MDLHMEIWIEVVCLPEYGILSHIGTWLTFTTGLFVQSTDNRMVYKGQTKRVPLTAHSTLEEKQASV